MTSGQLLIILIILLLIVIVSLSKHRITKNYFTNGKIFKAPHSFTKLKATASTSNLVTTIDKSGKTLLEKYHLKLNSLASIVKIVDKVNFIQTPSFFNSNEKWPGCLPRPLFQGTCGSCWGFASVTCLSSRFFIESCGNSGCNEYPQVNNGSIDDVFNNLNTTYSFNKIYLKNMVDYIDVNKNGLITNKEWVGMATKLQKEIFKLKLNSHKRHEIAQILVFMLDFQSMGSFNLREPVDVKKRAEKTFKLWIKVAGSNNQIDIKKLQQYWREQPLNLSAEKLIACCIDCFKLDFQKGNKKVNNPVCMGGSLEDAWTLLRDTGTTTTLCIGYNLDDYQEGDKLLSCKEICGPFYSFCSGYVLNDKLHDITDYQLQKEVDYFEKSGIYPVAMPQDAIVSWVDPQLFRFRAKNAYTIKNDMLEIQREIMQRGPVNSGFSIYQDFETKFGGQGLGGQLYDGTNPLGSDPNCLIYMKDPDTKETPTGGHAVTIVGWGNFTYIKKGKSYNIPYWTCLNSWGVEWGHNGFPDYANRTGVPQNLKEGGYFWIVRGINNCGIEENVTCGQPNIENMSYPNVIDKYGWGVDPPSLNNESVKFLKPLDTSQMNVKGGSSLNILPALEGGGTFINFESINGESQYRIKSMDPPSPYLMFWPNTRPTFCLGEIQNNLSKTDDIINLNQRTIQFLKLMVPIARNPLLLLGTIGNQEQIQLLSINEGLNRIKVSRAVNFNKPLIHKKGTELKAFPYENLYISFFKKNGFLQCSIL